MRCVFVSGKYEFCVQYLAPAVVENRALGMTTSATGELVFSIFEGRPVQYRTGCTAVFLPKSMRRDERKRLHDEFRLANPGVVDDPPPAIPAPG